MEPNLNNNDKLTQPHEPVMLSVFKYLVLSQIAGFISLMVAFFYGGSIFTNYVLNLPPKFRQHAKMQI